jgi:hypothetical protein
MLLCIYSNIFVIFKKYSHYSINVFFNSAQKNVLFDDALLKAAVTGSQAAHSRKGRLRLAQLFPEVEVVASSGQHQVLEELTLAVVAVDTQELVRVASRAVFGESGCSPEGEEGELVSETVFAGAQFEGPEESVVLLAGFREEVDLCAAQQEAVLLLQPLLEYLSQKVLHPFDSTLLALAFRLSEFFPILQWLVPAQQF